MSIMTSECVHCGGTFAHTTNCIVSNAPVPVATFERLADATLVRCRDVYAQRGASYGDTWGDVPWTAMRAVTRELGYSIDAQHMRAIAAAVLVDIKHQRLGGGYSDDSVIDGINYAAVLAAEMQALARSNNKVTERKEL